MLSVSDPFRMGSGQQPFNAFGQNARHPPMGGNSDMHGPMMPPNVSMMPNNLPYDQGNMMSGGGSNMMSSNMMPANSAATGSSSASSMPSSSQNMNMQNQMGMSGMMGSSAQQGGTSGPSRSLSGGDSVSVQNPFADAPSQMSSQYQGSNMGQPMPPYSSGMQQAATSMSSSYGNYMNRGFQGNTSQPSNFAEAGRMSGQNSAGSSECFPSASDNFSSTSHQMTNSSSSGPSFGQQQFSNRMATNMGSQSFNQQAPPQSQPQQSHMPMGEGQQTQQSVER